MYEYGFVDALSKQYRLILVDARGHGLSDKPRDPVAYGRAQMAGDVTAVLDELHVERAHFLGFSLGGYMGVDMAQLAPDRLLSLVSVGAAATIGPSSSGAYVSLLAKGPGGLLGVWRSQGALSPELTSRLLAVDTEALMAYWKRPEDVDKHEVIEAVRDVQIPCLLIAGDQDRSTRPSWLSPSRSEPAQLAKSSLPAGEVWSWAARYSSPSVLASSKRASASDTSPSAWSTSLSTSASSRCARCPIQSSTVLFSGSWYASVPPALAWGESVASVSVGSVMAGAYPGRPNLSPDRSPRRAGRVISGQLRPTARR